MSIVVPIEKVMHNGDPSNRDVKRVMTILERQGLIEPLEVLDLEHPVVGSRTWDAERLEAARRLGWRTVIIALRGG